MFYLLAFLFAEYIELFQTANNFHEHFSHIGLSPPNHKMIGSNHFITQAQNSERYPLLEEPFFVTETSKRKCPNQVLSPLMLLLLFK